MTIASTVRKAGPFIGDGVVTALPFAFKVFAGADLLVVQATAGVETTKVLTTDYTVTLNADQDASPGGMVNMLVAAPVGTTTTLASQVAQTQQTDFQNQGGFYPKTHTTALDKVTILIQQLSEKVSRVLQIPISSTASGSLPVPAANTFLGWDSLGASIVNYAGLASSAVSSAIAPVVAAATLALARAALGATAIGDALFTTASAAAARATLGAAASFATSLVRVNTCNGFGSTNTAIRRFTTTVTNVGTDITYADSATLGGSFTINTTGLYAISYVDLFGAAVTFGISRNSSQLTTAVSSITAADRIGIEATAAANFTATAATTIALAAGDVIRAHGAAGSSDGTPANNAQFTIVRVG